MAEDSNKQGRGDIETWERLREAEAALAEANSKLEEANKPKTSGIHGWWNEHIEANKLRWTYLITPLFGCLAPLAALFAAGVALWFNANQIKLNNDSQQFQREQAQTKAAADKTNAEKIAKAEVTRKETEKISAEKALAAEREKFDKTFQQQKDELAERASEFSKAQEVARKQYEGSQSQFTAQLNATGHQFNVDQAEKQFKDVQDRLASADEKTRAAAALQLAELAITPYPQKMDIDCVGGLTPDRAGVLEVANQFFLLGI